MDITVTNSEGPAIDLRSVRTRVLESLIPVVQRAAGPTALLRDTRLMVGVSAGGTLVARLVPASR
jgi:hypothetical protein